MNEYLLDGKMRDILVLMRPKHYIKNLLVFIPVVFSRNLFDISSASKVFLGFCSFSLLSSVVYIINDINALYDKVPFDEHAAFIYSKLYSDYKKNGLQPPIHDLQIAATAIANNMILVTRNTQDFENIPGIMLENWFSEN